jgi:hypothetical protein
MKKCLLLLASLAVAATPLFAQDQPNHFEVGAFAEYFHFTDAPSPVNFVGLGGRAGFNVHPYVQIEAEMAYDFQRNYSNTFSNGVTTEDVTTKFRTLHGLFGPKFQTGSGPVRFFVTGKVGFDNFTVTNQNATAGFTNTVGLNSGRTDFAIYPGGGIEAFAGIIGVRLEVGDDIFFDNGAHNNFKASVGPQFRF